MLKVEEANLLAEIARSEAGYLRWRLAEVQGAALQLAAAADESEWVEKRVALAQLLRQENTYCTWSLAMAPYCNTPILYAPWGGDAVPDVCPSMIGVTQDSSSEFLKALDLGGHDQRQIQQLIDEGRVGDAEAALVANKKGAFSATNSCYILTGGPLQKRRRNALALSRTFPKMTFLCIDPESEGRYTLLSAERELQRLVNASAGELTHLLLLAKGSTDLHMAWLSAANGVARGPGCSASEVHRNEKTDPSTATELFLNFVGAGANCDSSMLPRKGDSLSSLRAHLSTPWASSLARRATTSVGCVAASSEALMPQPQNSSASSVSSGLGVRLAASSVPLPTSHQSRHSRAVDITPPRFALPPGHVRCERKDVHLLTLAPSADMC